MKLLIAAPILIHVITAALTLLAAPHHTLRRGLSLAGAMASAAAGFLLLAAAWEQGVVATQIGNWPAPFGITLVVDLFSATLLSLSGVMGLAVVIYSFVDIDEGRETFNYYPLLHTLLMGISGSFLTGDIFNLYVWFEVMLMASFCLIALGGEKKQIEGSIKYLILSLISSVFFLTAVGILYGLTGTLNMADLSLKLNGQTSQPMVFALSLLFLGAFAIKAGVFPLFFWLPASYPTPPVSVSAIFAGLLTKVGIYALIRVFTLLFLPQTAQLQGLILSVSALTMVVGILGALAQTKLRRLLSFQIVSHVGYMTMGLGLLTPLAIAGAVFYLIHHIVVITNLFLISGVAKRLQANTLELKRMGGLYARAPFFSFLFLIAGLALAGVPPLSGFFPKLMLLQAAVQTGQVWLAAIALLVGLLTLYSMVQVWAEAFWKKTPEPLAPQDMTLSGAEKGSLLIPVTLLASITLGIGFYAEPVFQLSMRAAHQLLDPAEYIRVVLERTT